MILSDAEEEALNRIRELVGEHFQHFALVVLGDEDGLGVEYSSEVVGEALLRRGLRGFRCERWDDDFEWEDDDGDEW
jgi:hypothetical protein